MRCDSCGLEAPTKSVQLHQNIGMLVARRYQSVKGNLCKSCINSYFWRFMLVNTTIGWWGLISLFVTPLFIANNLFQFITSRGLSATTLGSGSLPTYITASTGAPVQCPHCQSYQTRAAPLNGAVIAGIVVAALLLTWGFWLELSYAQGRTSSGNMVIGVFLIGLAAFAALSFWMMLNNRMWGCQQCNRFWVPRRS